MFNERIQEQLVCASQTNGRIKSEQRHVFEAVQTDAAQLLQLLLGNHVGSSAWFMAVAMVTDADLPSLWHVAMMLLWRGSKHIQSERSKTIRGEKLFHRETMISWATKITFRAKIVLVKSFRRIFRGSFGDLFLLRDNFQIRK